MELTTRGRYAVMAMADLARRVVRPVRLALLLVLVEIAQRPLVVFDDGRRILMMPDGDGVAHRVVVNVIDIPVNGL